eukprot:SAG31_NODE_21749_length_541_cov_1.522624_1_plen_89_part_01
MGKYVIASTVQPQSNVNEAPTEFNATIILNGTRVRLVVDLSYFVWNCIVMCLHVAPSGSQPADKELFMSLQIPLVVLSSDCLTVGTKQH